MDADTRNKLQRARPKWNKGRQDLFKGILFIAPNYIGFIVFTLIPMVTAVALSFFDYKMSAPLSSMKFVGLNNFLQLPGDDWFTNSFKNTIWFAVGTVPVTIAVAFIFAYFMNKYVFFKSILRSMIFLPYVTNIVAVSYIWMALFQPTFGPVNGFLRQFTDTPPQWLTGAGTSLLTVMILQIWLNIGYCMIIYIAGLQQIPAELLEAAKIDGATRMKELYHVIIPLVSPTTFFVFVTILIASLRVFGPINLLTMGGPGSSSSVLAFYSYISAFQFYKMGYASAVATVLFLLIFIITFFQWRAQKKWVNYL